MSGIPAGAGALLNKRLGKYEILALLALGGTAEIYLARIGGTSGFEKYVVVKCLHDHLADDPDFVKMFLDEARISATLDHSNIVQTFELGEYENRYYMAMEFLAGLSLAMVVRRAGERIPGGMMPVPLVLNMAAQACAGLHYAHERTQGGKPLNLVHRDISPQNLVITFEGDVKVVDFGIARAEYRETKTKAGTIKGKFAYMSPEQCVANAVDRRTDVFALGVIVHELLTGRRLFKRNSPYETYQAVLECAVDPPSKINNQLDPGLDPIVMKAIAKDKDQRYATAEAFGDAMLGYLHHRGKGSGSNDIGRFFEQYFGQEIEEHGERMRELISGREIDKGMGWDEDDDKANETRDLGAKGDVMSLDTGDLMRPSEGSLDSFVGGLATDPLEPDPDADENGDAPRTRIEMNPLELMKQLDQQVAKNTGQFPAAPAKSSTVPAPTQAMRKPASIPPPAAQGAVSAPASRPSKFDMPNLPTVVAVDAELDAPTTLAPHAGGPLGDLANGSPRTPPASSQPPLQSGPLSSLRPAQPDPASAPTAMAPPLSAAAINATEPAMDAQVPPSDVCYPGANAHSKTQPQYAQQPPLPQNPPSLAGYPVMPGGQRPFSSDLAPSNLTSPQRSPYAQAPFDPGAAASLMSPVGEQYPQTDWERAAQMSAKAMPPWKLAVLFIAVVGGALLLTLLIAKLAH
jgi:serine/threonine-protein kinase